MGGRGKGGGKRSQKKSSESKIPSYNSFEIFEQEGGENGTHKKTKDYQIEKETEDNMETIHEHNGEKEDTPSIMEPGKDLEMTPSDGGMEDQHLQEILERENLELEKFLEQGINTRIDSLPHEEFDRVQQLFLRRSHTKAAGVKRNHDSQ